MRLFIALLLICIQVAEAKESIVSNESESEYTQNKDSYDYNCKAKNLSVNPVAPITYYEAQFGQDHTAFSIWRMPCQDGSFMPVMTIEPISRKPFVCSFNFSIEQNSNRYSNVLLLKNPRTKWSFLCGDIKQTKTVKIDQLERPYFNSNQAFTLVHKQHNHEAIEVDVPGINEEQSFEIDGAFSGTYTDSEYVNEEFIVQVTAAENDLQISVYWLSVFEGQTSAVKGVADAAENQEAVNIEMYDLFGFDNQSIKGNLKLEWLSCDEVNLEFESYSEQASITALLSKQSGDIAGLSCD